MSSGFQGYYDNYQYDQSYSYDQSSQYPNQPNNNAQYGQSYNTANQFQCYAQNPEYNPNGPYQPGYNNNQNNAQYSGQYSTQNANNNLYNQNSGSHGNCPQYTTGGNKAGSFANGYELKNFGDNGYVEGSYNSYAPTPGIAQNSNNVPAYNSMPNGAYNQSVNMYSGESGYQQSYVTGGDYKQNGGEQFQGDRQGTYNQKKNNYANMNYGGQFSVPALAHIQQPGSGQNSRLGTDRDRGQSYNGSGDSGKNSLEQYSTRGQGQADKGQGGRNGTYQGQADTVKTFQGRGHGQGSVKESRGFTLPQDAKRDVQAKTSEDAAKCIDLRNKLTASTGKENVPNSIGEESGRNVSGPVRSAAEQMVVMETRVPQPISAISLHPAALAYLKDNPTSPEVEAKLREMMQPLYCRLCSVHMNAPSQAVQHYEGKNHTKKVRMFLASSASITAAVKETTATSDSSADDSGNADKSKEKSQGTPVDEDVYCKICDVSFTSVKQSTQHYQGKNHAKKVRLATSANMPAPTDPAVVKGEGTVFQCVLCGVHVTTHEQLTMHLNGARHKNKLVYKSRNSFLQKDSEIQSNADASEASAQGFKRPFPKGGIWIGQDSSSRRSTHSGAKRPRQDFSNYRTPSGKFYCSSCNVTLNVESQFAQHVTSKRHKTNHAVHRNSSESVTDIY